MVVHPDPADRVGRHIMSVLSARGSGHLTVAEIVAARSPEYPQGGVACSLVVARLWQSPAGMELPVVLVRPKGGTAYVYLKK